MGEVIQVDGSGVRMPVAQRGKLRMTAVEVAHMRIDLRSTLFGLQVLLTGLALVLLSFAKKVVAGRVKDKIESLKSGF